MPTTTLAAIPLWVFPLFLGLLILGMRASKDRQSPVLLIYALPLLGLMSFARARALDQAGLALGALAACYLLSAAISFRLQGRWIISRSDRKVHLRGEWLTMVTIMGLFGIGFAAGMIGGMAPQIAAGAGFAMCLGALSGMLSGSLAGRALRVAVTPIPTAV